MVYKKQSSTHECLNGVNEFVSSSDLEKFNQHCITSSMDALQ